MSANPLPPIDRRAFLKIDFGTGSAAMLGGLEAVVPVEIAARPADPPYRLILQNAYTVDPRFNSEKVRPPTRQQHLEKQSASGQLSREEPLDYLQDAHDEVREWAADELEERLDTSAEAERFGPLEFARNSDCSPSAPGTQVFEELDGKETDRLVERLVEDDQPGSCFTGIRLRGDVRALSSELARLGMNLVIAGR